MAEHPDQQKQLEAAVEDGDETKQLEYATYLLKLVKSDTDAEENGKKAVDFLVSLSQKANDDATVLLRECVKGQTGITEANKAAVKWCLETSDQEKRIRESARQLFKTIHRDDSDGPLSFKDYVTAVKAMEANMRVKRMLVLAGKEAGDDVTEEKLSRILSEQIQGTLNMTSSERESQSNEFKSADMFTRVTKYPMETLKVGLQEVQDMVSAEGMSWVGNLLPTNQLYMISAFFLYSFLSASLLLFVIPLLVFYVTLAVLLVATLQIVVNRQSLRKSEDLANTLHKFDKDLDMEAARSKFIRNKLTPYWIFLAVLPLFVAGLSLVNKKYIPCSDLAVLSCIITGITFFFFIETPLELTRWLAMLLNLFSSLPTILRNFPDIPVISKIVGFVTKSFYTFDTIFGLKINISLPSISYSLLPLIFVIMALRHSGAGSYRVLLPFFITQVWFSVATTLYPYTMWFGLVRASVGNALLPVLLPTSIVVGILYSIYQAFQTNLFIQIAIAAVLGLVPLILSQTTALFGSNDGKKTSSTKKYVMLMFGVMGFLPLTSVFSFIPTENSVPFKFELGWTEYKNLCTSGDGNMIPQQNLCRNFIGQKVVWNGTFEEAQITQVLNSIEPMLTGLPSLVVNKIRCNFGSPYGDCNSTEMSADEQTVCKLKAASGQTCHFNEYDTFSFKMTVSMPKFKGKLTLDAGETFKNILEILKTGDSLEFVAVLGENQGTAMPSFQLKDIRCTSRILPVVLEKPEEDDDVLLARATNEAIATTVNFFLFPALEYSPKMT
ncbi:wolframin-like [Mizuhopecten yessoensis]|uniref:Wolframin n=1 Tax=Mizuhopecten yessoensis TaxID=6573 RepID=A0A210PU92_MIZYE|nr:wolframin-like [Mizuhopecten yessoensis]OWF40022.1 Wolframin [Mizuhopecten yessoensis]